MVELGLGLWIRRPNKQSRLGELQSKIVMNAAEILFEITSSYVILFHKQSYIHPELCMNSHRLCGVISQDDEENVKTSTLLQSSQRNKSDEEVLKMYKKLIGDDSADQPLPRIWQQQISHQRQKTGNKESPAKYSKPSFDGKNEGEGTSSKFKQDKSFELSSLSPNLPGQQVSRVLNRNATNYSEGYKESKPFSLKKQPKTATVYKQEQVRAPPSPQISVKQSTAENFIKKLNQQIVKDKGDRSNRIGRTVMQMRTEDKRLREQIKQINNEEERLQESIRDYHRQYKQYCRSIEEKHNLNRELPAIRSAKQILTLDPQQSSNAKPLSKKTELIQQYKPYTDEIELEMRKMDYLINTKRENIKKEESAIESNRLTELLLEPIEDSKQSIEQQRPVVEGPTYKQIMKARKNKNFFRLQQLIGQTRGQDNPNSMVLPNQISSIAHEQPQVYQNEQGQMRVNQQLRNLLLD